MFGKVNLIFAYIFIFFSLFANIFALHQKKSYIHIAANLYVGSSIGAVLGGDFITLFIFWEIMAITSAILIWNKDRSTSAASMLRYLLIHGLGGLCFFSGLLMMIFSQAPLDIGPLNFNFSGILIFLAFAINAGLVPFHAWIPDAYPQGTPEASVYLCTFTTKVAVYAFAQCFLGSPLLLILGLIAAVVGVVYALMENDIRRLLSYHIICQVGYMVVGIGMGTHIALNGGIGHAVGNILFKGLLFMASGAILLVTKHSKLSNLGGLFKYVPLLFLFHIIGSLAIAGMPGINGYITKSLLVAGAGKLHLGWIELILIIVAVGTFMSIGLKLTYFAFFSKESSIKNFLPLPQNTIVAMSGLALSCIMIGIFPDVLYRFLPYPVKYEVFSMGHIMQTLQLLLGTLIGFLIIAPKLHAKAHTTLDVDWLYRKGAGLFYKGLCLPLKLGQEFFQGCLSLGIEKLNKNFSSFFPKQMIAPVGLAILCMMFASLILLLLLVF
jgi:multicomponent Na+:H+ antiporter subunit D